MVRGLYTSALGMITHMQRMDVTTNNMANVNTTGYKRDHVVSHAFSDRLMTRLNDPGIRLFSEFPIGRINPGVFVDDVFTDWQQGAFQQTGNHLDVAISGQGFFVVSMQGQEENLYTRDGTFSLVGGVLLTKEGGRVQGQNGDITIPDGNIVIDENGRIFANEEYIDTLLMTNFSDLHSLRKTKDNFFTTTDASEAIPFVGTLQQGFLEGSNINIVNEMVQMITLSRAYETNARMITLTDQTLQHAVNSIGSRT